MNDQLVPQDDALTLTTSPNVKYAEAFTAAQRTAREQGAGLWSGCTGIPLEATDDAPVADDQAAGPVPQAAPANGACDASYPDFCVPPAPPDLNCTSAVIGGRKNFAVRQPDPHHFDTDKDGIGCEARR